jgi:hypothetical protein
MVHLRPVKRLYGSSTARWKAIRFIFWTISRTYGQLGVLFGRQPRRHLRRNFLCISFVFYGSVEVTTEAIYKWFHFSSTASVWLQHLLCQPRAYAFGTAATRLRVGALTTCLRVWCTYKALTNQGEVHQYIDHVVCFNTRDSHHHPKEYTILYVFRALRYDSLVPLNWYKQVL